MTESSAMVLKTTVMQTEYVFTQVRTILITLHIILTLSKEIPVKDCNNAETCATKMPKTALSIQLELHVMMDVKQHHYVEATNFSKCSVE
jgi:hypothetical protein